MEDGPVERALHWTLFCRVVDNFGDIGVCWRLARGLAACGQRVRLVADDASALAWMAPAPADRPAAVEIEAWDAFAARTDAAPGDVVVEAFGCDPPPAFVTAMARRTPPPVWINLEYLSAEDCVERCHRLPSPLRGGPLKWFFYPGFTPRTGGLLRERGLVAAREAFDGHAWLAAQGWAPRDGERVVTLFCYEGAPVASLLNALAARPTLLLATPGAAQREIARAGTLPASMRAVALPWLPQPAFDRLLWSADLNFVRGEDSLVRALWAGRPFVWHAYPQHDGAHHAKVEALIARAALPPDAAAWWRAWNRGEALPAEPEPGPWREAAATFCAAQAAQPDLVTQLLAFVGDRASTTRGNPDPGRAPC